MKFKKLLCSLLLTGTLTFGCLGLTACKPNIPDESTATSPSGGDLPTPTPTPTPTPDPDPTPTPTPTPTPDPDPVYDWRVADILHSNVILSGKSDTITDKDGNKKAFTAIVNRQIDAIADEIISRLEYVYGNTNANETHTIKDTTDNSTFATYSSVQSFGSISSSDRKTVYDADGNSTGKGYIKLDKDGNKVTYTDGDAYYISQSGKKYAAICSNNVYGNFTSPTAFLYHMNASTPTIAHTDGSYGFDGILTFKNAIYGTPTWEYEEVEGTITYYNFTYNTTKNTIAWNWATNFSDQTAKENLKKYIAYIIANNVTNYNSLPSESTILSSNYNSLIANITTTTNYADTYQDILLQILGNRVIGTTYNTDITNGNLAQSIADAIYKTSQSVYSGDDTFYYENGNYKQLNEISLSNNRIKIINKYANTTFNATDYQNAKNYKAYDVVLRGILRQIANQSAYLDSNNIVYQNATISTNESTTINTFGNTTDVYVFTPSTTDLSEYRIRINLESGATLTITDQNGHQVAYMETDTDANKIVEISIDTTLSATSNVPTDYTHQYGTSNVADKLQNTNYLVFHITNSDTFTLVPMEEYQVNA